MDVRRLAAILSQGVGLPANVTVVQNIRTSDQTAPRRVRLGETGRAYIIVRNMEASNIAEVGFTTNGNNIFAAPTTGFVAINPGQEYYEAGSTNQVFVRPQTNGQSVLCQVEVVVARS